MTSSFSPTFRTAGQYELRVGLTQTSNCDPDYTVAAPDDNHVAGYVCIHRFEL